MGTRIATIALTLALLRASVAAADESGRVSAVSAPALGVVPPAWTIQFSQTPPPEPSRPGGHAKTVDSEPLLTLEEALTITLKENRGVRAAGLDVERAGRSRASGRCRPATRRSRRKSCW